MKMIQVWKILPDFAQFGIAQWSSMKNKNRFLESTAITKASGEGGVVQVYTYASRVFHLTINQLCNLREFLRSGKNSSDLIGLTTLSRILLPVSGRREARI